MLLDSPSWTGTTACPPDFADPQAETGRRLWGHGPAFCEQKGTTADGTRAVDRLCKNLPDRVETLFRGALASIGLEILSEFFEPGIFRSVEDLFNVVTSTSSPN